MCNMFTRFRPFLTMCRIALIVLLATVAPTAEGLSIPALCYHQVRPGANGQFELTPEAFREQLGILKAQGYQSLSSAELLAILASGTVPAKRSIVLSFDDGYASVYDYAFPIMKEMGFTGIACIYPRFIGAGNAMSWDQLRELASAGWSIESHSMSHANLATGHGTPAYAKMLELEIKGSRTLLEKQLGLPVKFMVWPYGIYTEQAEQVARDAGYAGAMTVDGGANYAGLDPFRVKRQVVYRSDTREKFLIRLGMASIEVTDQQPRPGEVLSALATVSCRLPALADYSPETHVLNVKATDGSLEFRFDPATRTVHARPKGALKPGHRFIDVYLRDKRTGITAQHGWLFTLQ
ncbi:MAG TPA: polysaccharide deacetylase family protein [Candidatus Ozemobacteraceae bacterium]|nr:polysaccharide deacetylase family protein [Candidatus Ozemobacteraceae bacterium]HQG27618.1 polysaccharide deacetylase family protein [Candidatus Ozemobacteraceae bacterium]